MGRESLGRRGGKVLYFERRGANGPAAALHGSERTAMMELADHAAIVLVQTLGKLGEARDEPVIVGAKVDAATHRRLPVDAGYVDGTDTALGHALV